MPDFHIFDLDGTLIDSKAVTLKAYAQAAEEFNFKLPVDIWGRSAREWNCPPLLHHRKTEIYASLLHEINLGWAYPAFVEQRCAETWMFNVWTGASSNTINLLLTIPRFSFFLQKIFCACSLRDKAKMLTLACLALPEFTIHYYDDDPAAAQRIVGNHNVIIHLPEGVLCK